MSLAVKLPGYGSLRLEFAEFLHLSAEVGLCAAAVTFEAIPRFLDGWVVEGIETSHGGLLAEFGLEDKNALYLETGVAELGEGVIFEGAFGVNGFVQVSGDFCVEGLEVFGDIEVGRS